MANECSARMVDRLMYGWMSNEHQKLAQGSQPVIHSVCVTQGRLNRRFEGLDIGQSEEKLT